MLYIDHSATKIRGIHLQLSFTVKNEKEKKEKKSDFRKKSV